MQFYQLARGARLEYQGKVYTKTAMDVSQEDTGQGGMFRREWEVKPVGEPLLLSLEEAKKCEPLDWQRWAEHLTAAPGQAA